MSYEGNEMVLCKNGHLHEFNCYDTPDYASWRCFCGASAAWIHNINLTNGSFCEQWDNENNKCLAENDGGAYSHCKKKQLAECKASKGRIDGWFELEVKEEAEFETCECCGHSKMIKEKTYKIPEGKGHLL